MLAGVNFEVPVSEYSPREIKKSVVGNGAASKEQVQYMIKSLLKLKRLRSSSMQLMPLPLPSVTRIESRARDPALRAGDHFVGIASGKNHKAQSKLKS